MTTQIAPVGYPLTIGTASQSILPVNPSRKGLIFFNPSLTNIVSICPSTNSTGGALAAVANGAGSIAIMPGSMLTLALDLAVGVGAGWNAIASGAATPFTVWEF